MNNGSAPGGAPVSNFTAGTFNCPLLSHCCFFKSIATYDNLANISSWPTSHWHYMSRKTSTSGWRRSWIMSVLSVETLRKVLRCMTQQMTLITLFKFPFIGYLFLFLAVCGRLTHSGSCCMNLIYLPHRFCVCSLLFMTSVSLCLLWQVRASWRQHVWI